jgi:hypothetical protein
MDITPQQLRKHLASIITDQDFIARAVADYEKLHHDPRLQEMDMPEIPVEMAAKTAGQPSHAEGAWERDAMQRASKRLLTAILDARNDNDPKTPTKLIWNSASGLEASNCHGANSYLYQPKEPVHTNRDPCFRCGTRADLGCEHMAVAA